jgi:hypothetical protein
MSSVASQGLNQFGGFLKASGAIGICVTILFLLVRFNIVKVLTIQEGETGLLVRRGKVKLDKKTGLPKLVNTDRYQLHVAIFRHIAIVNNRARPLELGSIPFTVGGESWTAPLSLNWSIRGDAVSMRNALTKVSDGNRFDEKFTALEAMVKKQCIAGLKVAFDSANLGCDGAPPTINFSVASNDVKARFDKYGCDFEELLEEPLHRSAVPYDGMKLIADSISALPLKASAQPESDEQGHPKLASV